MIGGESEKGVGGDVQRWLRKMVGPWGLEGVQSNLAVREISVATHIHAPAPPPDHQPSLCPGERREERVRVPI